MVSSVESGSWGRQLGVLLIGMYGAVALARERQRKLRVRGLMGVGILFFFCWAFASLAWSDDVALAARRVVCFAVLGFAAFAFACHYEQREVLQFLFMASSAFVCLGLVAEVAFGAFTPSNSLYRFCGTLTPNTQAWNCAGLALSGVALGDTERRHRSFFFCGGALGIAALVLTRSRASVGAFVLALVIYKALVSARRQKELLMGCALSLCAVLALLCSGLSVLEPSQLGYLAERSILLGRDAEGADTLTGRTPLWRLGVAYFCQRPLVGYGFNAFDTPQHIREMDRGSGWAAGALHSDYFELLLGVGCIGAVTYVLIMLGGLRRSLLLYKLHRNRYYAMECAIVVFLSAAMLLENPGLEPNVLVFVFYTIIVRRGLLLDPGLRAPGNVWLNGGHRLQLATDSCPGVLVRARKGARIPVDSALNA